MFWKIFSQKCHFMHESFWYCQNIYKSWLLFECGHNHNVPLIPSPIFGDNWAEESMETMGRGIQDMNNMNRWTVWALWAGRSLQLSSEHLTFPCTRLPTLVTGSGQSSLSIFSPLFDRSFSPLWLGEICLSNGACDVCQGLPQHFTSRYEMLPPCSVIKYS